MQTYTYSLMCKTSQNAISDLILEWWEIEDLNKKEIIKDRLPNKFSVKYRRGHLLGEASIFVEINLRKKDESTVMRIKVSQSDLARWSPKEELEKIVCWYCSSLTKHSIEFEMKPGLFQSVIEC